MREPRAPFRAVVVRAGRPDQHRELRLPVHALGTVRNAETVLDAEARMARDLLPREPVRADVESAPALRERDEAGDRHRALGHRGQAFAVHDVVPVAWCGAADLFAGVETVDLVELVVGIALRRPRLDGRVLAATLPRVIAVGAEAPAVGARDELAVLIVEVDVIDLLDRPPGEGRLVLHQILEPRFRRDRFVARHRTMPAPV